MYTGPNITEAVYFNPESTLIKIGARRVSTKMGTRSNLYPKFNPTALNHNAESAGDFKSSAHVK